MTILPSSDDVVRIPGSTQTYVGQQVGQALDDAEGMFLELTGGALTGGLTVAEFLALEGSAPFSDGGRFVGYIAGGPPASAAHLLNDWAIDTANGCIWLCKTAGTPGAWDRIGSTSPEAGQGEYAGPNQTGVTTLVSVTGLTGLEPDWIGTRAQRLNIWPAKVKLTATSGPLVASYYLVDNAGTLVPGPGARCWVSAATAAAGEFQPVQLSKRFTAAQLASMAPFDVKFSPVAGGTWSILADNVSHRYEFVER